MASFVEEQPVGKKGDVLFSKNPALRARLNKVAEHIVSAAIDSAPVPSMTFLAAGGWGTGKSSALRYLREVIEEQAPGRVLFAEYSSPLYQGIPTGARASLIYVLIRALDESTNGGDESPTTTSGPTDLLIRTLLSDRFPQYPDGIRQEDREHLRVVQDQLLLIEALEHSTRTGVVLEHWLEEYTRRTGHRQPLTTVILVDDLDRCSPEFAKELLIATNFWSRLDNHFFIIAADEDRLHEVLQEHSDYGASSPERGLKKYVHVAVSLPSQISKTDGEALFESYLGDITQSDEIRNFLTNHLERVRYTSRGGPMEILEPLVDAEVTPRTFKDRFNAFATQLAEFTRLSDDELKRQVIALRWPLEFRTRLYPAEITGDLSLVAWRSHFIDLGRSALSEGSRELQVDRVRSAGERSGFDLGEADPMLAIYLASSPAFPPGTGGGIDTPLLESPKVGPFSSAETPTTLPDSSNTSTSDLAAQLFSIVEDLGLEDAQAQKDGSSLRRRILSLSVAIDQGMSAEVERAVVQILDTLRESPSLPANIAPVLGNVALRLAGNGRIVEAAQFHLAAIRADQSHANVAQNFVDFVADQRIEALYPLATEMLQRLQEDPAMQGWRPLRRQILRLRIDRLLGSGDAATIASQVEEVTSRVTGEPDSVGVGELVDVFTLAREIGRYDLLPSLAGLVLGKEHGQYGAQVSTVRLIADALAESDESADEEFASDLYSYLLQEGLIRRFQDENLIASTLHNFGVLLGSRRDTRRAGYLMFQAFLLDPTDEDIRLVFARWLNQNEHGESAEGILSGRLAPETIAPPTGPPFGDWIVPHSAAAGHWISAHLDPGVDAPYLPELFSS